MKKLADTVHVERRFALSARLDTDLNGTPPLTGYVLQASVRKAIESMISGIREGSRYSFTWTGPYGGGKSCAALLVASLVAGSRKQKALGESIVGAALAKDFQAAFPSGKGAWNVLALTGRRMSLSKALADAAAEKFGWSSTDRVAASVDDTALLQQLFAAENTRNGLLIVIDELGKFLEHAMHEDGDVHVLQDLAELAARSNGRVVVIGILHQSFEQYAGRLSRTAREEWAKVQGRYQNVPFVAQADEIAALLSRAIVSEDIPKVALHLAEKTAIAVAARRPADIATLSEILVQTWPLHPVTALLLGPVSRQRFAQNERSVFGFLSSAEPHGFQAHLAATNAADGDWYGPDQLWDYLVANFGSALSVGPDGGRMTLALDVIERASLRSVLAARLTKAAALIELFRNGSGLAVADDVLILCAPGHSEDEIGDTLKDLVERAILIRQPRLGGYALFAGSDFDLDEAMDRAGVRVDSAALADLAARLGLRPVAAKRHYFLTGALRVFDVAVQFFDIEDSDPAVWATQAASKFGRFKRHGSGFLILVLPVEGSSRADAERAAEMLSAALEKTRLLAAVCAVQDHYQLREHIGDLYALDHVERSHPQIEGDRIARRELSARRVVLTEIVRYKILNAFLAGSWFRMEERTVALDGQPLSIVASNLCSVAYVDAPIVQSELLYRDKPSSSAMAGLRALMHAMVTRSDVEDLGISGYPAERGLYLTVLRPAGLHAMDEHGRWRFANPDQGRIGRSLVPAWKILASARKTTLSEIYARWADRPFGMKRGVMPIFALAFLLAHRNETAIYVDGLFQAIIDEIFVDRMMQDPSGIEFRRIVRSKRDEAFVKRLALVLSRQGEELKAEALPVASALFQRFHALPIWAQKTTTLPDKVRRIRDIVLKATDPEALLFSDLTEALIAEADPVVAISEALLVSEKGYPLMLHELRLQLADLLGVDPETFDGLGPRAITASGVTADLRLDAFIMRSGAFASQTGDIEGLASLLVHKPPRNWTDREHEQAVFEMAKLARRFREAEMFAGVKNRAPTAQAISVVVGIDPKNAPHFHTFEVTEQELRDADKLADDLLDRIRRAGTRSTVEMAALARVVERLSGDKEPE
ncbi:ATP-binding protein [Agrobacterium rhizogenes]|nr:ATP-binding protein [Rhizobium rhizogenes]